MTRLHADPVEVQRQDSGLGPEPAQFLWRSRLYVVREVLARWTEAGGWWQGDAVRAVSTGDTLASAGVEAAGLDATGLEAAGLEATGVEPAGLDDRERDWWRVEAGAGRSAGTGVYDLCFDWSRGSWTLARVLD